MSNNYRIFETTVFREGVDGLSEGFRAKVVSKLRLYVYPRLRAEPHYGPNIKKLKDWKPETWRYRIGSWRLFYEIDEGQKAVLLTVLDHRKDAY